MDTYTRDQPRADRRAGMLAALVVLTLALLAVPSIARATAMTVAGGLVHISDDGQCSLREAIANAEADAQTHPDCPAGSGADVITLAAGTYALSSGRVGEPDSAFVITTDVTLVGTGSVARVGTEATVLDAGGAFRHFEVVEGASLHLEGLHLTEGSADEGGAVRVSSATFSASDVRFTANGADEGGAVWAGGAYTSLTGTVLTGNQAVGGAAIFAGGGTLTIVDSLVSHNHTGNHNHGVVHTEVMTAHVAGSTIRDNTGIALVNDAGYLTVVRSTVSGNDGGAAGALFAVAYETCAFHDCASFNATTTIRDSTISGNTASAGPGAIWSSDYHSEQDDGGVLLPASLNLTNVTIASNHSVSSQVRASQPVVRNTVISDAIGGLNCDVTDDVYHGMVWNGHHNVSDDPSCSSGGFAQVDDALLGPLAFNGGPTATHLPHPASPLVDAGDQAACDEGRRVGGGTDQRGAGFPRTIGTSCDIGSVEADADDLIGMLIIDVEQLAFRSDRAADHEGLRTSLLATLGGARDAVDRGDYEAASGQLEAFQNQVAANEGKRIAEADADRLIMGAEAIVRLFPSADVPPEPVVPPETVRPA